jgi:hypothetical protein
VNNDFSEAKCTRSKKGGGLFKKDGGLLKKRRRAF